LGMTKQRGAFPSFCGVKALAQTFFRGARLSA
jgi:hypothetical protein